LKHLAAMASVAGLWPWLLPFALQALAMAVDELGCHRRRPVPRWEWAGHLLDTLRGVRPRVCTLPFLKLLITGRVESGFQFRFARSQRVGYCGRARKIPGWGPERP